MGLLGFSGETYYFAASKSVRLLESPEKNYLAKTIQKAVLKNVSLSDSILHSYTKNYGSDFRRFMAQSKAVNTFWNIQEGGLYIKMLDEAKAAINFSYIGQPTKPPLKEIVEFRYINEFNSDNKIRDYYVASTLEKDMGMDKNKYVELKNLDVPASTRSAKYVSYTMGDEYFERRQPPGWFQPPYDQTMRDFSVRFLVTAAGGSTSYVTKVFSLMYKPEERTRYVTYTREGSEDFERTYVYEGAYSDRKYANGWPSDGSFNGGFGHIDFGEWYHPRRLQYEIDNNRYFVDPVPLVFMGGKPYDTAYGGVDFRNKTLGLLGLDWDSLYDSVMDVGSNDSTLDLEFAEVEFSVFVRNPTQPVMKYLWKFFHEARRYAYTTYEGFRKVKAAGVMYEQRNLANRLGGNLYYNYIQLEKGLSGNVAEIGEYTSSVIIRDEFSIYHDLGGLKDFNYTNEYDNSDYILLHQTGPNTYDRITVNGLLRVTKYTVPGDSVYRKLIKNLSSTVKRDSTTVSTYADEGLRIPIHTYIWEQMSGLEQEEISYSAVNLHMQVLKEEYLEWYKTQGFLDVVKIVLVAVTIITAGQSSWFEALLSAGSLKAAALIILEVIFYAAAISAVFDIVIDILGDNFALVAAVVALVAAAYTGNMDFALKLGESTFATNLLQMATLTIDAVNRSIADDMKDLLSEQAEWEEGNDERQLRLIELEELLDTDTGVDLMDTFYGGFLFMEKETPSLFYARTQATNIAGPALSFPSRYVEDALNLNNITNEGY